MQFVVASLRLLCLKMNRGAGPIQMKRIVFSCKNAVLEEIQFFIFYKYLAVRKIFDRGEVPQLEEYYWNLCDENI